jgi:hypothetical protein
MIDHKSVRYWAYEREPRKPVSGCYVLTVVRLSVSV